jgi:NAD(P) transhydrogenase
MMYVTSLLLEMCRSDLKEIRPFLWQILSFCDDEIVSMLKYEMRVKGARFLLGETIEKVEKTATGVKVFLTSGKVTSGDALLYTVGRQASTDGLNLEAVGLGRNKRGLLTVNKAYQTEKPHIYAVGDCIGAPSLASTSMEQGRLAACHMWEKRELVTSQLENGNYPYGIYTIPEISMVGKTEQQLTSEKVNYEIGLAKYSELAKGQMSGGAFGMLKILFDPDTLRVHGVHAIGEGATEIIHIGQVAIAMGCSLTYFRDAVFNYPTLAEAYRVAALNGLGRLSRDHELDD